MNNLRKHAWELYRKNAIESWLIGLLSGLLIAGIVALDFLLPGLFVISIPLLCLPILFAAHVSHYGQRFHGRLSFGNTVKQFFAYFRRPFNSSFGYLFSLLKGFICFWALEFFFSFTIGQLLITFYPGMSDSIEELMQFITNMSELTNEEFQNSLSSILSANNNALYIYLISIIVPAFSFGFLFLIYNISRNSASIYVRMNIVTPFVNFPKMIYRQAVRDNRMKFFKNYWSLNWPMYPLFIIGSIGGVIGMYFIQLDVTYLLTASIVGGLLLTSFFLPFYLNNMLAIDDFEKVEYANASVKVQNMIRQSIEENRRFNEEQKNQMDAFLQGLDEKDKVDNEKNKEDPPNDEAK